MSKQRRVKLIIGTLAILLLTFSVPTYRAMMIQSREESLRSNLLTMRNGIDQYKQDKHRAPQVLQDLVDAGYFRELPIDPITNSNSTWRSVRTSDRGITDVRSGSDSVSSNGTRYSAW
jgi:general secretion pathway protein G